MEWINDYVDHGSEDLLSVFGYEHPGISEYLNFSKPVFSPSILKVFRHSRGLQKRPQ